MQSVSKISTLGGLIKEVQQERNIRKQKQIEREWNYQAIKSN